MSCALTFGEFMLPRAEYADKWCVVACDQYTSRPDYWEAEDARIGGAPSTLRLICPEAFLGEADARMSGIAAASREYVDKALRMLEGGVLVTRTTSCGVRHGLVCLADLEKYDFSLPSSLIRATEGTVVERIPPRLAVREVSVLDVSHVICLIDDPARTVIEPLVGRGEKLYDVALPDGGRLEGRLVRDTAPVLSALTALESAAEKAGRPFVLVGDGNHSLAAAKALYEKYKAAGDPRAGRARYALVEAENLRSDGVTFLPIHRVVYGCPDMLSYLESGLSGGGKVRVICGGAERDIAAPSDPADAYSAVQRIIDESGASVDYIHGDEELRRICGERSDALGVLMPPLGKDMLFSYVARRGVLPRKSFSLGEAEDKRLYMECRYIG